MPYMEIMISAYLLVDCTLVIAFPFRSSLTAETYPYHETCRREPWLQVELEVEEGGFVKVCNDIEQWMGEVTYHPCEDAASCKSPPGVSVTSPCYPLVPSHHSLPYVDHSRSLPWWPWRGAECGCKSTPWSDDTWRQTNIKQQTCEATYDNDTGGDWNYKVTLPCWYPIMKIVTSTQTTAQ